MDLDLDSTDIQYHGDVPAAAWLEAALAATNATTVSGGEVDDLSRLLNRRSNLAIDGTRETRRVVATRPIGRGDIIGPAEGLPVEAVLDPVRVLRDNNIGTGEMILECYGMGTGGGRDRMDTCLVEDLLEKFASTAASSGDQGGANLNGAAPEADRKKQIEEMAFWIALASMANQAYLRRQKKHNERRPQNKKRRLDGENDGNGAPASKRNPSDAHYQLEVYDAYLLSLPREGPDPCCWSSAERTELLSGTPLLKQIDNTLQRVRKQYDEVIAALYEYLPVGGPDRLNGLPPFSIDGRGTFPSVLWARSMHQSRSFPRSLADEEGVWWMGRKGYVPPSKSLGRSEAGGASRPREEAAAAAPTASVVDDIDRAQNAAQGNLPRDCNQDNRRTTETILSVRLGGYRAPVITIPGQTQQQVNCFSDETTDSIMEKLEAQDGHLDRALVRTCIDDLKSEIEHLRRRRREASTAAYEGERKRNPPPGSTLGIMLPLHDMMDHKPGHAVQWESAVTVASDIERRQCIRFRAVDPIKRGEVIYNNYGPKGNPELLATYGFATRDNPLDSVEGIVLGINAPAPADPPVDSERSRLFQAQMACVKEHMIPHRFKDGGGVLLLGPFSLHRKNLPACNAASEDNGAIPHGSAARGDAGNESDADGKDADGDDDGGGVVPEGLYQALGVVGMEAAEEGPAISLDEMEMLRDVLTKKLDGFGAAIAAADASPRNRSWNGASPRNGASEASNEVESTDSIATSGVSSEQVPLRAQFVEAYKDGQRKLLEMAIAEVETLMSQ